MRRFAFVALVVGVSFLVLPSSVRADWTLFASENAGAIIPIASGTYTTQVGTTVPVTAFGDFIFSLTVEDFENPTQANLSLISITANNTGATSDTLHLFLSGSQASATPATSGNDGTGFGNPPSPFGSLGGPGVGLAVESSIASNSSQGAGNSLSFETWINGNNTGFSSATALPFLGPIVVPGGANSFGGAVEGASGVFQVFNQTNMTIAAGGNIHETGSSIITTTPEPATMTLALSALGFAACPVLLKRKRAGKSA